MKAIARHEPSAVFECCSRPVRRGWFADERGRVHGPDRQVEKQSDNRIQEIFWARNRNAVSNATDQSHGL